MTIQQLLPIDKFIKLTELKLKVNYKLIDKNKVVGTIDYKLTSQGAHQLIILVQQPDAAVNFSDAATFDE